MGIWSYSQSIDPNYGWINSWVHLSHTIRRGYRSTLDYLYWERFGSSMSLWSIGLFGSSLCASATPYVTALGYWILWCLIYVFSNH